MEKKYVKPEMVISEIEMDELMLSMSNDPADPNAGGRAKDREEWFMETDLWGNESWTRIE